MTEYTRNQIVSQAATSMLAQANSMPQTALQSYSNKITA
jgi:flagellin-like hook-associated protein FlgL